MCNLPIPNRKLITRHLEIEIPRVLVHPDVVKYPKGNLGGVYSSDCSE